MSTAITSSTPIGKVAAQHPGLLPLFDRLGLDYCCHGHASLRDACMRAGVSVHEVLAASAAPPADADDGEPAWIAMSMSDLCDDIEVRHHAFARDAFARLESLLPRVVAAHADHHPELALLERAVRSLRDDMMDHMIREERVLFPWLRRLERAGAVHIGPPWSVRRPIDCMEHDHEMVAAALALIRSLTNAFSVPAGACGSYAAVLSLLRDLEQDTRVHIHKENNILFPAGIRAEASRERARATGPGCASPGTVQGPAV